MLIRTPVFMFVCFLSFVATWHTSYSNGYADEPAELLAKYATVRLSAADLDLTPTERRVVSILIEAAKEMDAVFWKQACGDRDELLASIKDVRLRQFAEINYGPWDRLDNNRPFVDGVGAKPTGARFYPHDLTVKEFESYVKNHPERASSLRDLYTVVRRGKNGELQAIPYHLAYPDETSGAASLLEKAAATTEDAEFAKYLRARAAALRTDKYQASDMIWMDMKQNRIDVVIGPIETYEDRLFGRKAAHECYVLVKDMTWNKRLERYAEMLPELQKSLPVPAEYKKEKPGAKADLYAYDVVYYAGDCNAGSKTIAINLPNDEEVQLKKGSRRLQLKNAMRAKFDRILLPIGNVLISEEQRKHLQFHAFFGNTMFHEVAHGLGVKYTIDGKRTVRESLRDVYSALEEGKADILGLYMLTKLSEQGELKEGELMDYYVTFLAGIFRSVRFGASSAHGRANMIRFNFFKEKGAFRRGTDGLYRVEFDAMQTAMTELSRRILVLQGEGDYRAASQFVEEMGFVGPGLQADLERVSARGVPVDVVFDQ
ncbi:MAG: hypothetical protein VB878_02095 [Pirellulaceae bacterium]